MELKNTYALASIYDIYKKDDKVSYFGYTTVRSFAFFHLAAKVIIQNCNFHNNYFFDGYLTNFNNIKLGLYSNFLM